MRPVEAGDFFLMPYTGTRRSRLIKAIQPVRHSDGGQWYVSNEAGMTSIVLLSSCQRCPPSVVSKILKTGKATP